MAWFQKKAPDSSPRAREPGSPISALLREEAVLLAPPGLDKAAVLEAVVGALCRAHGLGEPAPLLACVREREQGISTTLDSGLSLPHARIDGIERVAAALAIAPHGLRDPKQPDVKVRAMFLFFSPNRPEAFTRHLQLLRGVSTLFQSALISELCALKTPAHILARLRAAEA